MPLSSGQENIVLNKLSAIRRIEDQYILELDKTFNRLERNLTDFLNANKTVEAVDTALARQQLEQILIDSGYYQTTGNLLNDGYQAAINEANATYQSLYGENFQFQEVSLQQLNSLKNLDFDQFKQLGDAASQELNRIMTDLQFGAIDFNQAVNLMREQVVDKLKRHAQTWVTTGLSGIYRESTVLMAQDNGIEKFQYVGPVDSITRDFCRSNVGQTKTKDQWEKTPGAQLYPVMTYGGGYNCRHSFIGVVENES